MGRISMRELSRSRPAFLFYPSHVVSSRYKNFSSLPSSSSPSPSEYGKDPLHCSILIRLRTCHNTRQLLQIHGHLITSAIFQYRFWFARVLKRSSDFGDSDYANLIFRFIGCLDTFFVNCVIRAYLLSSAPHKAVVFYYEMLRTGFCSNSHTFVQLFGSCAKMGDVEYGQKCHGQAVKKGVDFVLPVQNSLIHMYACCGDIDLAGKMFVKMTERDLVSWNSIIDGYAKMGYLRAAHKLFDVMPQRNVVSWNIMINGYLKGGNPGFSLKLFREMVKTGLRGNDTSMVGVLTACGRSARLKEGRSVHGFLMKTCLQWSTIIATSLIDMYGKCKRVEVARRIFNQLLYRNLVCWNAMILGHCIHGNPKDGLSLFHEMVDHIGSENGKGFLPDEITYVGVLCACARSGLLMEGRNYFDQMIDTFSIKPKFAHRWCMANLFAVAGLIQEAEEILRSMSEDDEDISSETLLWANLLNSCRFHGDVAPGERIAKSLIDKEPENFSYYRLLMNIYAVAGQWGDVEKVKVMVKKKGMRTMPGCNLVDLNEIVHNFKVDCKCKGLTRSR